MREAGHPFIRLYWDGLRVGSDQMVHTTLDTSKFDAVTAYESRPHRPAPHVDYMPTPADVARRVTERMGELGYDEDRVADLAHVDAEVVRSLRSDGLSSLRDARAVFEALGMRVYVYPAQMVRMSL